MKSEKIESRTGEESFYYEVIKQWHTLPRQAVDITSVEVFKARLCRALSSLIKLKMSHLIAGGLDLMTFKGPIPTQTILRFYENPEVRDFWLHVSLYRKQHDLPGTVIRVSCFLQKILVFLRNCTSA